MSPERAKVQRGSANIFYLGGNTLAGKGKANYRLPFGLIVLLLLVAGCAAGPNFAPVVDLHTPPERTPEYYVVQRGDTLYSIAFRYGLDFRGLASANGVSGGATIYPGQRLRLVDNVVGSTAPVTSSRPEPTRAPVVQSPNTQSKPKPSAPPPHRPAPDVQPRTPAPAPAVAQTFSGEWEWPVSGRILRGFSGSQYAHKGIDIAGNMEQPVKAAGDGVDVYAGSGLVGYGKLLIVKHNERYLSAYAHNNRLLVEEGEQVKQGQVIARMGDTGTDSVKLHFEIRKDGKPVDPVTLLPKGK